LPKIEEDRGSWLRRPKPYERVVEPHKKKKSDALYVTPPNFIQVLHNISRCVLSSLYPNLLDTEFLQKKRSR